MQAIEQHGYVARLLADLGDPPEGERLEDNEDYDTVDAQMMKLGTMQQREIDFARVESISITLLETRSKDLRLLAHLLYCLQRDHSGERFALSLLLLCKALDSFWEDAWPFKGAKGKRGRTRLFSQIMQRAGKEVDDISFNLAQGDGPAFALTQLAALEALAREKDLPDDEFGPLTRALNTKAREATPPPSSEPSPAPADQGDSHRAPSAAPAPAVGSGAAPARAAPEVSLASGGDERAQRKMLLQVADFLNETNPADPLGYRLRRHAVWGALTALPMTKDGVKTELMPVSVDRIADYRDALNRGADPALLSTIEGSIAVSPYWVDGHAMAARAAEQLGYSRCSEAIADETRAFLGRLDGIGALTFKDGTPFVSEDTMHWLEQQGARGSSGGGSGDVWFERLDQAMALLESEGLAPALTLLEDGLREADGPRARYYWRLTMAELTMQAGFTAMAQYQFDTLGRELTGIVLEDWEPRLIERVEKARATAERGQGGP